MEIERLKKNKRNSIDIRIQERRSSQGKRGDRWADQGKINR